MYDDKPSSQLVDELYSIAQNISDAKTSFEKLANITGAGSDVNLQAYRQIDLLDSLCELIPENKLRLILRYKYRPQKKLIGRIEKIRANQSESIYEYLRKYGPKDIQRLKARDRKKAEYYYSDGIDRIHHIMEARSITKLLSDRHGSYNGYISDRTHRLIEIIVSALVGAAVALATNNIV